MPLFRFACQNCGKENEILVRGAGKPSCPDCGSTRLEKQMSRVAPVSSRSVPSQCAGCCEAAQDCSLRGSHCAG